GPLLLIGIGALFLARNIIPDLPLLDYLARYWPWLLILWGGLRLLEVSVWAAQSRPLPSVGINGGEWVLVVFLCLFGFSLHAVRGFSSWLPRAGFEWGGLEVFGESYEYPVSADATSSANPRIVIEGFRGNARVVGVDSTGIKVMGHQTIRSMDQATADRASKDVQVEVTSNGNEIVIRAHQDRLPNGIFGKNNGRFSQRITADLEISVPKGATIVARGRDGDFDISAINGQVEFDSENSSVRLENIGGDVRLGLTGSEIVRAVNVRGDFQLQGRGNDIDLEKIAGQVSVSGSWGGLIQFRELAKPIRWDGPQTDMTLQGLPGELRMTIGDINGSKITGPLRINSTYSKDIALTDISGSTDITLARGDIRLTATVLPVAPITVRLNSGNVELALPETAKFTLNAVTDRGEAYSDYGGGVHQDSTGRRGATIQGGTGGANIDIHINRGMLNLRRSALSDAKSALPSANRLPAEAPTPPNAPAPRNAPPRPVEQ
ncbi:MAG: DUF4097 family beta strand repeat-containing protein, partial [Acidobacteriota bacterium]